MFEIIDSIKICEDGRIIVKYKKVNVIRINGNNYISLTDLEILGILLLADIMYEIKVSKKS